jgi:hypothetical protein
LCTGSSSYSRCAQRKSTAEAKYFISVPRWVVRLKLFCVHIRRHLERPRFQVDLRLQPGGGEATGEELALSKRAQRTRRMGISGGTTLRDGTSFARARSPLVVVESAKTEGAPPLRRLQGWEPRTYVLSGFYLVRLRSVLPILSQRARQGWGNPIVGSHARMGHPPLAQ